jgi:hypothetical protein
MPNDNPGSIPHPKVPASTAPATITPGTPMLSSTLQKYLPRFTVGNLGTSTYVDPGYSATITNAALKGFILSLSFNAVGQDDLDEPGTSCVQVSGPNGVYTFGPLDSDLSVNQPGHYSGELTFPATIPGSYSFTYSCQGNYTQVPIGIVHIRSIGVSGYTGNQQGSPFYEATVISSASANGETAIYFAATGPSDLDDPSTSCLQPGTSPVGSPHYQVISSAGTLDELIVGTLTFEASTPATFQYGCSNYTTVQLP